MTLYKMLAILGNRLCDVPTFLGYTFDVTVDSVTTYYKTSILIGVIIIYKCWSWSCDYADTKSHTTLTEQWRTALNKLHELDPKKYNKNVKCISLCDPPEKKTWKFWEDTYNGITHATADDFISELKDISDNSDDCDLAVIIRTNGGEITSVKRICDAINTFKDKHNSNMYAIVMTKAFSGGSLIALSTDEIMMNDFATLSKVDPQIFGFPIKYYKDIIPIENNLKETTVNGLYKDVNATMKIIMDSHIKPRYDNDVYETIMHNFMSSDNLHACTFTKSECKKMGINVADIPADLPSDVPYFDEFNKQKKS